MSFEGNTSRFQKGNSASDFAVFEHELGEAVRPVGEVTDRGIPCSPRVSSLA